MSVGAVHGLVAKDVISTLIPTNGTKALWVEDIKRERERERRLRFCFGDGQRKKKEGRERKNISVWSLDATLLDLEQRLKD